MANYAKAEIYVIFLNLVFRLRQYLFESCFNIKTLKVNECFSGLLLF